MLDSFVAARPRLMGLAYRMLGSWSEAEDVVQDAWLRWSTAETSKIEKPLSWLARVVSNLCLDQLKSARAKRETYVGPWLPEPVLTQDGLLSGEPIDATQLSLAFLHMLEKLSPLERIVYVLSEAFDYTSDEVAEVIERDPAAVRQLLHRARTHLQEAKVRFAPDKEAHARMLGAFAMACASGDVAALSKLLASDIVVRSDGGGKARAALREIHGVDRSARLLLGTQKKGAAGASYEIVEFNGWPGAALSVDGEIKGVIEIETDGQQIFSIQIVTNPEKLRAVASSQ
jgi:RNA polymerase sigma-70 factor (ECF subfamily)